MNVTRRPALAASSRNTCLVNTKASASTWGAMEAKSISYWPGPDSRWVLMTSMP